MSCTSGSTKKTTVTRRTRKGKGKKGKRVRKQPLSFIESPREGEYHSVELMNCAACPVAASTTCINYRAEGKWVSPQFKNQALNHSVDDHRTNVRKRRKQKDLCRMETKSKRILPVSYQLRSMSFVGNTDNLQGQNEPDGRSDLNSKQLHTDVIQSDIASITVDSAKEDFEFENGHNFNFNTPEIARRTSYPMSKSVHVLFSGCTPKLNRLGTVLVKDTP